MFDENQIVRIRWNNSNREWYRAKGYTYTKRYDYFDVHAKDLPPGSNARVIAVCDYCGREYDSGIDVIRAGAKRNGKQRCAACASKKTWDLSCNARAEKAFDRFTDVCSEFGYIPLTKQDEYTGMHMRVRYICPRHGEQEAMLDNMFRGHKCLLCSYEERAESKRHDQGYIDAMIHNINGNEWINKGEFISTQKRNIRIRCKCGNEYTTSFFNFLYRGVRQCMSCSNKESTGEVIVRQYLEEHGIQFVSEMRFHDCKDKKTLPFDFYLPDFNLCIEFDGRHHYEELDGFSSLEIVQRHDMIKNEYCKQNGIRLIRIPYYNGHDVREILDREIYV